MARRSSTGTVLSVQTDQPLIGLILEEDRQEIVHYFADEADADAVLSSEATVAALSAIGSWSDLDWEATAAALDRIRHESEPTPPVEL